MGHHTLLTNLSQHGLIQYCINTQSETSHFMEVIDVKRQIHCNPRNRYTKKKLENREVPKGPPLILPGISDVKGPPYNPFLQG